MKCECCRRGNAICSKGLYDGCLINLCERCSNYKDDEVLAIIERRKKDDFSKDALAFM